jgi:hypothetical protein
MLRRGGFQVHLRPNQPLGILEGEEDPGEMIRWFSHPGIMTRTVEDTALLLDVLAERKERKRGLL